MDNIDNEDPLGKISRQLSEMGPIPQMPIGNDAASQAGLMRDQWRQFGGGRHAPFHNLYTWNPMDLPDKATSAPVTQTHLAYNPEQVSTSPGVRGYNSQRSNAWAESNHLASHMLPAGNGFPMRPSQPGLMGFEHSPLSTYQMHSQQLGFQGDPVLPANMAAPQHTGDSFSSHDISPPLRQHSSEFPPGGLYSQQQAQVFDSHSQGGISGASTNKPLGRDRAMHTPPLFDPSTPPPIFLQRQLSDSFVSTGRFVGKQPTEQVDIFLQSQSLTSKVNLDLGTNIESPSIKHVDLGENRLLSEEGMMMYKTAMEQWQEPAGALRGAGGKVSPVQPRKEIHKAETSSLDKSKPSYSEIARTPKNPLQPVATKVDTLDSDEHAKPATHKVFSKKDVKAYRPTVKRTSSGSKFFQRGASLGGNDQGKGPSSSSRYGLDNFGEVESAPLSSSLESLPQARSRRESGSSAESFVNALDDFPLTARPSASHPRVTGKAKEQVKTFSNSTSEQAKTPKASSGPTSKSAVPDKEHVFFDPKRIFQSKASKAPPQSTGQPPKSKLSTGQVEAGNVLLNNGKPTATGTSAKLPSNAKQHDYINNDLRDASKLTNKTAEEFAHHGAAPCKSADLNQKMDKEQRNLKHRSANKANGSYKKEKRKQGSEGGQRAGQGESSPHHQQNRQSVLLANLNTGRLEEMATFLWERLSLWGNIFLVWLLNLLIYGLGLILYIASSAVHLVMLLLGKCWIFVMERFLKDYFSSKAGPGRSGRDHLRRRVGLEENIVLPSTGEEAMKRLLACRGKDPYSILGLRVDASDDEIKKYYRKQAVLVHPDKNQEPGAEEAFKVLGHAFEMIGDPSKRRQYDSHAQEELEADAMREFADMLTKLQTKIQEAANIMRCDTCGGKHRRVPVDRPFYSARYCLSCDLRHQAKEGDVWAESTMLGFYWHYYALMEGHVYDITEWMKCHREYFQDMKANAHSVMFRIATDGDRKNKHHHSNEANLEDFINRLLNKSSSMGGHGDGAWGRPFSDSAPWGSPPSTSAGRAEGQAASSGRKGGRRKKRR